MATYAMSRSTQTMDEIELGLSGVKDRHCSADPNLILSWWGKQSSDAARDY